MGLVDEKLERRYEAQVAETWVSTCQYGSRYPYVRTYVQYERWCVYARSMILVRGGGCLRKQELQKAQLCTECVRVSVGIPGWARSYWRAPELAWRTAPHVHG